MPSTPDDAPEVPAGERLDEVQALAEAVLEAARVAGLGVMASFDEGSGPHYIYVNDAAARILGRSADELVGTATVLSFAPEERARMQALGDRWARGESAPNLAETVVVREGGGTVPVEVAFSVVPLAGEPAVVTFLRDISERKRAEAALRRSEQRFRQLIEGAPDAIGVYQHGRLVFLNPALVALCGRPFDELVDHEMQDFVHADDRALLLGELAAFDEGPFRPGPLEYRILRPDGRAVNVETSSISIEYEGRPALLGFTRDTTERKLLQAHLVFRDRMATLGMLAASVAHEINNPLAYARLNVETLVRQLQNVAPEALSLNVAPVVAAARDGLTRMAAIVHDLQRLSAPTSTERWPVDVKDVLESALNVAMHAIRQRARLERDYRDVPVLKTDPTKLGQIFLNLVVNATESFETDAAELNVIRLTVQSSVPNEVSISVSDNGPGVSKERLERIFEPFFTTKSQGMGLGLSICQMLAGSLGGTLGVVSEVGKGTTFTLQLPAPDPI